MNGTSLNIGKFIFLTAARCDRLIHVYAVVYTILASFPGKLTFLLIIPIPHKLGR